MNIFSVKLVALLNDISVWWHCIGVAVIVGFLAIKPDHHGFSHSWLWSSRALAAHEGGVDCRLPAQYARRV